MVLLIGWPHHLHHHQRWQQWRLAAASAPSTDSGGINLILIWVNYDSGREATQVGHLEMHCSNCPLHKRVCHRHQRHHFSRSVVIQFSISIISLPSLGDLT